MSLIYRGMWTSGHPDLHRLGVKVFGSWIEEKYNVDFTLQNGDFFEFRAPALKDRRRREVNLQVETRSAEDDEGGEVWEFTLKEEKGAEFWITRLRTLTSRSEGWIWVDTEQVSDDPFVRSPPVIAPRFVPRLIDESSELGGKPLTTRPRAFRPQELESAVEFILDPDREVPVAVFSFDLTGDAEWVERAERTAKDLAGLALVWLLPPDAVDPFQALIGRDMAVWGGGVRTYLPVTRRDAPEPNRHRYISAKALAGRRVDKASRTIGWQLAGTTRRRRPPHPYRGDLERRLKTGGRESLSLDEIEELLSGKEREAEQLERRLEEMEEENYGLRADLESEQERANRLGNKVAWMESDGSRSSETFYEAEILGPPAVVESIEGAVDEAVNHCPRVIIPSSALIDIEAMEDAFPDHSCGNAVWSCLLALQAYADAGFDGDFRRWCEESDDPRTLAVAKVAMRESERVASGKRSRAARTFAIDPAVGVGESVFMPAHLKPLSGFGDFVPRIYFFDDVRGITGMVHVGAIGPHRKFPNTKS